LAISNGRRTVLVHASVPAWLRWDVHVPQPRDEELALSINVTDTGGQGDVGRRLDGFDSILPNNDGHVAADSCVGGIYKGDVADGKSTLAWCAGQHADADQYAGNNLHSKSKPGHNAK
jgi:hypothetical protein